MPTHQLASSACFRCDDISNSDLDASSDPDAPASTQDPPNEREIPDTDDEDGVWSTASEGQHPWHQFRTPGLTLFLTPETQTPPLAPKIRGRRFPTRTTRTGPDHRISPTDLHRPTFTALEIARCNGLPIVVCRWSTTLEGKHPRHQFRTPWFSPGLTVWMTL